MGGRFQARPPSLLRSLRGARRRAAARLSRRGRGGALRRRAGAAARCSASPASPTAGPGSLRAAVEARGPRTILFDVAGTIRLASDLVIREPRVTIAGQSAPGGGIALADAALIVDADDVVIRHIRVRRGDRAPGEGDSIWIAGGRRIILDHVSASWSVDETLSASARYDEWRRLLRSHRAMVDHRRIAAPLAPREGRARLWQPDPRRPRRADQLPPQSLGAPCRAHAAARAIMPGRRRDPEGPLMEFRSNLFYNWGRGFAGYNDDEATLIRYSFIDNAYLAGPDSEGALAFRESNRLARAWFAGNSMNGVVPADPWSLVGGTIPEGYRLAGAGRRRAGRAPIPRRSAIERVLGRRRRLAARRRRRARRRQRPHPRRPPYRQPGGGRRLARARRRAGRSRTATATACPTPGSARTASIRPAPTAMATATATA